MCQPADTLTTQVFSMFSEKGVARKVYPVSEESTWELLQGDELFTFISAAEICVFFNWDEDGWCYKVMRNDSSRAYLGCMRIESYSKRFNELVDFCTVMLQRAPATIFVW